LKTISALLLDITETNDNADDMTTMMMRVWKLLNQSTRQANQVQHFRLQRPARLYADAAHLSTCLQHTDTTTK